MGPKQRVPFLDLKAQHQGLRTEIDEAVRRTLDSNEFVLGSQLREFEEEYAAFCGTKHAIGVSSGTAALHLALLALGVGPGDEVITTPVSFVATVEAIMYTGATPVFVDIADDTLNLDPTLIERAITPRTKVILPVHWFGEMCDMQPIGDIARRHNLEIVEDAAQAHGSTFQGKKAGSFGAAAGFSFYPSKNLGCAGDGGAITTDRDDVATDIRALRHHAQYESNVFPRLGFNCRLDSIQAGILSVKLKRLEGWNQRRREIAGRYKERLQGTGYRFQETITGSVPSNYIFAVRHPNSAGVRKALDDAGIGWGRHIVPPIHQQPGYQHLVKAGETLPVSEQHWKDLVSLPVFPELSDEQVDYVADVLGGVEVSV